MDRMFRQAPNGQPMALLSVLGKPEKRVLEPEKNPGVETTVCTTPFGVSFYQLIIFKDLWGFVYDPDLSGQHPKALLQQQPSFCSGVMSNADLWHVLLQLRDNPDLLRQKSQSLIELERLTNKTAYLKNNYFGGWHIYSEGKWSLYK